MNRPVTSRQLPFAGITQIRFEGISHPIALAFQQSGPLALHCPGV
ncbi:hypothetical protein CFter6_0966 [Collimonas fungivorans]|uniref:Uncharacterized protein n=1 Tax=Collimonas fungivorans TaxID=158899 RepID=A0A127P7R7_9BURK|nr:hypothetical protein CFter6_0966 [Collimonas fungivorans]